MATVFTVKDEKKVSVSAAVLTAMQEKATAFILKQAYTNNVIYKTVDDIVKHKSTKKYLQQIFVKGNTQLLSYDTPVDTKSVGGSWINTFFLQHEKMLKEYSNPGWQIFDRDDKGGFMNYISNLVKDKFKIPKKDAWNPADIWLIKSSTGNYPSRYRTQIEKAMEGAGASQTLAELNVIMRAMFKANEVVGISLKKISGQSAKYAKVNADEKFFKNLEKQAGVYSYSLLDVQTKLGLIKGNKEFENVNTIIYIADSTGQERFTIQMQGNTTSRAANLKFDAKDLKSGAALIGKVPLDFLRDLAKMTKGIPDKIFDEKTRSRFHLALKLEDFEKTAELAKYKAMFTRVKGNKIGKRSMFGAIDKVEVFVDNMKTAFKSKDERTRGAANNKLLQLYFIDQLLSAPKKARNTFVTDMIFLAAKQGRMISPFGVFGKLY